MSTAKSSQTYISKTIQKRQSAQLTPCPCLVGPGPLLNIPSRRKTGPHAWFIEHLETSHYERLQSIVLLWQKRVGLMVYPSSGVPSDKNTPETCNFNCAYGLLNCKRLIYYPIFLSIWEMFFNPCKARREFNIPSSFSRFQSGGPQVFMEGHLLWVTVCISLRWVGAGVSEFPREVSTMQRVKWQRHHHTLAHSIRTLYFDLSDYMCAC